MVGTGASAIQFVPHLADEAAEVTVFQRTPAWITPRADRAFTRPERWLFRRIPPVQRLYRTALYWARELMVVGLAKDRRRLRPVQRVARRHLERQVPDPQLRQQLTPDYTVGCKRILISNDFYPTLARRVHGRAGRRLADVWADGMRAHLGATVPGFPNLFLLIGPNTGLGHTSMVFMMEAQMRYLVDAITTVRDHGLPAVEVKPEVIDAYDAEAQRKLQGTVWTAGGCASWYLDVSGRNSTLWPDFTFRFRRRTRRFRLEDHEVVHPTTSPASRPAPHEERVPA